MNITIFRQTLRNIDRGVSDLEFYDFLPIHKRTKQQLSDITHGKKLIWTNVDFNKKNFDDIITDAKSKFFETVISKMPAVTKNLWVFYLKDIIANDSDMLSFGNSSKEKIAKIDNGDDFLNAIFDGIIKNDYLNSSSNQNKIKLEYISQVISVKYYKDIISRYQKRHVADKVVQLLNRKEAIGKLSLPILAQDSDVKAIDVIALSCYYFVTNKDGYPNFKKAIDNGVKFRIIIANPEDEFCRKQALDFITGPTPYAINNAKNSAESFISIIEELEEQGKFDQVQLRYFNNSMPCSIFRVYYKEKTDECKVDLYSFKTTDDERRSFVCDADNEHFDFYTEQFDCAWENAVLAIREE